MKTWRSLLWKEWREQCAVGLAILAVLVLVPLLASGADLSDLSFGIAATAIYAMPLFALFVGMGISSGEHSRGTVGFLQALPDATWKIALIKLCVGLLTLVVPVLLAILIFAGWSEFVAPLHGGSIDQEYARNFFPKIWGVKNFYVSTGLAGSCFSASLLIWTIAFGANRKDEISAGAVVIVVIALLYAALFVFLLLLDKSEVRIGEPIESWIRLLIVCFPGGVIAVTDTLLGTQPYQNGRLALAVVIAVLSHGVLIWLYLKRYGSSAKNSRELNLPLSRQRRSDWLSSPRHSSLSAIGWKTWRELSPLGAVGVAIMLSLIAIYYFMESSDQGGFAYGMWCYIGGFVSIALGVGTFREDLESGLLNFWRSRPASVDQWFFTKLATGTTLILGIAVLGGCLALALQFIQIHEYAAERLITALWKNFEMFFLTLVVHLGLYFGAIMLMVLVRRPIFAAVMDVGLLFGGIYCIDTIWRLSGLQAGSTAAIFLAIFLVGTGLIGVIAAAWQAFKKNWSLESWFG